MKGPLEDLEDSEPINRGVVQLVSFCARACEGNGTLSCWYYIEACEEPLLRMVLSCMDAIAVD